MTPTLTFTVYGMPAPQGSKSPKGRDRMGRVILVESSKKVKPWREAVKWAAFEAMLARGIFPFDGPLWAAMVFTLPKPKSAPKTRETFPDRKPDLSKLVRSTEDALSDAGLWADDARVVEYRGLAKVYPNSGGLSLDRPGAVIQVGRLDRVAMPWAEVVRAA